MGKEYFECIHKLITTGHWVTDQVGIVLKEYGITEPQYNVLRTLKEASGEPLTVQALLDRMVQRNSNITRLVDKLVAKGLVERQVCPSNRRKMDITLTKLGEEKLKIFDEKVFQFHAPLMEQLNETEFLQLSKLIDKLTQRTND